MSDKLLIYSQTQASFKDVDSNPQSNPGEWYAGGDEGKVPAGVNNPAMQSQHNIGPAPQGFYTIGAPIDDPHFGPVMWLTPDAANVMFGRSGFGIHCKNAKRDAGLLGTPAGNDSSDGCLVAKVYAAWLKIADLQKAGYARLQVTA